jgi:hypothetical protein
MSSKFGLGHSRKYATLTSLAAEFATEIERLRAMIDPRIKLIIFFILFPLVNLIKLSILKFNFEGDVKQKK